MSKLKLDSYELAREAYDLIRRHPCITRVELNHELKTTFDAKRNAELTNVIRSMLIFNHIRKRFYRDENRVEFWISQNSTDKGDPVMSVYDIPDYLEGTSRKRDSELLELSILELLKSRMWLFTFVDIRVKFVTATDTMVNSAINSLVAVDRVKQATIAASDTMVYYHSDWHGQYEKMYAELNQESKILNEASVKPATAKTTSVSTYDGRFRKSPEHGYLLKRDNPRRKHVEISEKEYAAIIDFYEKNRTTQIS